MINQIKNECPNSKCKGSAHVFYKSKDKMVDEINFNCTTDSYSKPDLLKCESCKIIFSDLVNRLKENDFEEKYSDVIDEKYISQIKYKQKYFISLFKKIKNFLSIDTDVLEIGSYYGALGSVIKDHVKSYSGLELSKHGADYSKQKFDLNIYNESIETHMKNGKKYDVILMADVIEHFSNPYKITDIVQNILKKDGILIMTTFNMDSLYAKIMGFNYHWIIPMHLFYFSNHTIGNMGKDYGLDLFKIKNDPRYTSCEYLFEKLQLIFPNLKFIFSFLLKIRVFNKLSIKINLGDLKIYFFKKI